MWSTIWHYYFSMTLSANSTLMFDQSLVVSLFTANRQEKSQLRYSLTASSLRHSIASFSFIDKGCKKLFAIWLFSPFLPIFPLSCCLLSYISTKILCSCNSRILIFDMEITHFNNNEIFFLIYFVPHIQYTIYKHCH